MRFPARYESEVRETLKVLGWNLCPCTGEPQIEVIIRPVVPPNAAERALELASPFDLMEGLGDETPTWSGSEVADD